MFQILYKGKVTTVKTPYVFSIVYRMLAEKDFNTITIEKMEDE